MKSGPYLFVTAENEFGRQNMKMGLDVFVIAENESEGTKYENGT
jgi:hypothetical protein